ncbi:unnamed protein product [Merluccius merluccius]
MKELIPGKLPSSTKSNQKFVKCTVYLDIYAVTCPEALLAQPEDVYLSVCVMGQYRKTRCVPPVFPLLFSNKMVFVRTFPAGVVDPADVSEQLESDTSTFELIQMVPPEGEILATVEEGTRDFVFPGPRLTSREAAPERAIFLKSSLFPGITPMVEFATTAVIEEIDGVDGQPATPVRRRSSFYQTRKERGQRSRPPSSEVSGYQQPTVASMSRALSPYTHRRMSPHVYLTSFDPHLTSDLFQSQSGSMRIGLSPDVQRKWRGGEGQTVTPVEAAWSIPGASSSRRPSNLGTSSFNERLHSGPHCPSQWEQIHSRVQRILQTHGMSPKQLTEEEEQQRTGGLCGGAHWGHPVSQDRSSLGEWADGIHSRKQTSHGRPPRYHRAAFEESLGKIYKSMYQKAYDN